MKQKMLFWLLALGMLWLCGCSFTGKSGENVHNETDAVSVPLEADPGEMVTDVEVYEETVHNEDENVDIVADFSFSPHPAKAFVYPCEARAITMEEIKHWASVLYPDAAFYEPATAYSREEIQEQLEALRERIADRDALQREYSGDSQAVDDYIDYIESLIFALEEAYPSAPEKLKVKKTDWKFHDYEYYDSMSIFSAGDPAYEALNRSSVFAAEVMVNGYRAGISAYRRDAGDYLMNSLNFGYTDFNYIESVLPKKYISQDDAKKLAGDVMQKLGFSDWSLESVFYEDPSPVNGHLYESYYLRYAPVYDGIPSYYYPLTTVKDDDPDAPDYYYQNLTISIVKGMVSQVGWQSPVEITGEPEAFSLLPTADIYEKLMAYLKEAYTLRKMREIEITYDDYTSATVYVDNARLEMFRMKDKESGAFKLIPAWVFTGSIALNGHLVWEDWDLAVISAIDGSVMDIN